MRGGLLLLAGAAVLAGPAWADDAEQPEIVVTAPLEGAARESLQGALVLRREEVIESLVGGLGDTLDHAAGVATTFYGAGASRPIIRGLGDDRVRVLQNGIGAIDASSASPDHAGSGDGLDAERIEVLRGSAALAYGGNAVGGVVNIIDGSIPMRRGDARAAFDSLAAYTTGDDGRQGALAGRFGAGAFALRADIAARDTDDYAIPGFARSADARAADPVADEARGHAPNSWTRLRSYTLGGARVGEWGFAGLAVKRYESEYGLPPEDAASRSGGHIELEQTRIETRGDVRLDLGPIERLDWGAQHADYAHAEFEDDGAQGTRFTSKGYEARLEAHTRFGPLTGVAGLQGSDVDFAAQGDESFIDPTNTRDTGLFVLQRWDHGAYGVEGGARYERRELENAAFGERSFDAASAAIGVFARPASDWFIGATLARTERAPTAIELFADGPHLATGVFERGDPALGIETARSIEASVRYGGPALNAELNLYRIAFDDYAALLDTGLVWFDDPLGAGTGFAPEGDPVLAGLSPDARTLPVFAFTARDVRFEGGEASIEAPLFNWGPFAWRGDASLEWVRARFDNGGALPRIPPRSATFGLTAQTDALSLRLESVLIADQERVAAGESATAGATLWNARASWRPFAEARAVAFIIDARNLTDEESRVHASFLKDDLPRPGRSVRFALVASF